MSGPSSVYRCRANCLPNEVELRDEIRSISDPNMNILEELGFKNRDFDHPVWITHDGPSCSTDALRRYAVSRYPDTAVKRCKLGNIKRIYEREQKE